MGLKSAVQAVTKGAFNAVGDIAETAYYYAHGSSTYDVSSGSVGLEDNLYLLSAIFTRYKQRGGEAQPVDLVMLVPQTDVIFVPDELDKVQRIEHEASVEYEVLRFKQDPAQAHYRFWLIRP